MRKLLSLAAALTCLLHAAVLVDRIAVVSGKHVIKTSDIDRNLRMTSFMNAEKLDLSSSARRTAANHLVDQQLIREELEAQGYGSAVETDADALQGQLVHDRFHGSSANLKAALQSYGVSQQDFQQQLLWQLTVLQFIDERFRPGVLVTDEEIAAYYQQHLAEIKKESPKDFRLETVSPKIKATLEGQRIDQEFEMWISQTRKQNRIDFKEEAFQ